MGFPFPVASRLRVIGLRTPTYKGLNTGPVVTFHHETGNLLAKIQAFVSHLIPISGGSMSALIHQMSYMFIPGWWYTYPSEKYESQW